MLEISKDGDRKILRDREEQSNTRTEVTQALWIKSHGNQSFIETHEERKFSFSREILNFL